MKIAAGMVMFNNGAEHWGNWRRVKILAVDLLGAVTVIPEKNPEGKFKEHTFTKEEAARLLKEM